MNILKEVKNFSARYALKKFIKHLPDISYENLIRMTYLIEKIDWHGYFKRGIAHVRELFINKHPSIELSRNLLKQLHPNCRNKFIENFLLRSLIGGKEWERFVVEEGEKPPYVILISPTMRCNLHCVGCYAGNYSPRDDLELEVINRVIKEGKEMGIYLFTILGGEPFVRPEMLEVYREHNDAYFQVFTNGTLLNEETVRALVELGNVAVIVSVDGFELETDRRRGPGLFKKIMKAMDLLRESGILQGFSTVVTRENAEAVASDEFIDMLIAKGSCLGWYFLYMPIGRDPDLNLMPTPQQRLMLRDKILFWRDSKPVLIFDFWSDAPYVGGCIAGGRYYLHINSKGDVEPCIFIHFATDNVKDKSLREIWRSPFFKAIRARQPYSENLLLPCCLIDHPHVFREIHAEIKPYPTHEGAESLVRELKDGLDRYAQEVRRVYEPVWQKSEKRFYKIRQAKISPRLPAEVSLPKL